MPTLALNPFSPCFFCFCRPILMYYESDFSDTLPCPPRRPLWPGHSSEVFKLLRSTFFYCHPAFFPHTMVPPSFDDVTIMFRLPLLLLPFNSFLPGLHFWPDWPKFSMREIAYPYAVNSTLFRHGVFLLGHFRDFFPPPFFPRRHLSSVLRI